jgi:hypothetical protein
MLFLAKPPKPVAELNINSTGQITLDTNCSSPDNWKRLAELRAKDSR